VTVTFLANTVYSAPSDTPGIEDVSGRVGNRATTTERFTTVTLTARLADPVAGANVDADLLNDRGYFDVTLPLDGATRIDLASVTDLDPEFTVTTDAANGTIVLDGTQAPARIGDTGYTFRYWYTGTFVSGNLTLTFTSGSFNYLDGANEATPNTAGAPLVINVGAGENSTWIDVAFSTAGDTPLDFDSFSDALKEITLSGNGLGSAALVDRAPTRLYSNADALDNDGDGLVDEADENVFRYYVSRGFVAGSVTAAIHGAGWSDRDGNPGADATQSFQVITAVKTENGQGGQAVGQVFFIEISGGIKLQGLGFTDEPIVDIRGAVKLEIGDQVLPDGSLIKRFQIDASGTIKIIKLGNIGSAAARFVLQTGDTVSGDPEFWGVARIQVNLDFLKNYGIFAEGNATLQINTTPTAKTETIALEGIPGDAIRRDLTLDLSGLSTSVLGEVDLPSSWDLSAIDADPHTAGVQTINTAGAKVQTIIKDQQWKIITRNAADATKLGPSYFLKAGATPGKVDLLAEGQTFELPRSRSRSPSSARSK
jgi:hypothetical protein